MTTIPKSVPQLDFLYIAQIEGDFLIAFPYEHSGMDTQVMLNHLIAHSFSDKVAWLADRPNIVELVKSRASTTSKSRFRFNK